jgi:hypothetical protein
MFVLTLMFCLSCKGFSFEVRNSTERLTILVLTYMRDRVIKSHLFSLCLCDWSTYWRDTVLHLMCHLILGPYGMQRCKIMWSIRPHFCLQVYPVGFGKGAAGLNGTGFQLLIIIFMELFGVTLGQLIASISPSVQASNYFLNVPSI